jgi:MFS transporter, SP family, sugar:H+ symporter
MWLRPNAEAVDTEISSIGAAIEEDKENSGKALFLEMFRNPVDRRRMILAVAAVNTQAASGAMFIIAYVGPEVLTIAVTDETQLW